MAKLAEVQKSNTSRSKKCKHFLTCIVIVFLFIISIITVGHEKYRFSKVVKYSENISVVEPLSANPTKWSNTLKQFVGNLPTNCLSVFDHFVIWALKGLSEFKEINFYPSLKSSRGDRSKLIRLNSLNSRS